MPIKGKFYVIKMRGGKNSRRILQCAVSWMNLEAPRYIVVAMNKLYGSRFFFSSRQHASHLQFHANGQISVLVFQHIELWLAMLFLTKLYHRKVCNCVVIWSLLFHRKLKNTAVRNFQYETTFI